MSKRYGIVAALSKPEAERLGVEIAGWHLHFATRDRRRGGHLLGCELEHGTAELDHATRLHVELPPPVDATAGSGSDNAELLDRLEHDRSGE